MTLTTIEPPAEPPVAIEAPALDLRAFTFDERRDILPVVTEVLSAAGCWLRERRFLSFSQVEFLFELQLRQALDLYSALIAAGLELTPDTHAELTGLCTLRRHNHRLPLTQEARPGRILSARLEVSFLEETALELGLGTIGLA
jgi:hypothetical protein